MDDGPPKTSLPQLNLRLNRRGVVAPVYRAVRDTNEVLGFALDAIEKGDPAAVPPIPGGLMGFGISTPDPIDVAERRASYNNWLLSKAFQDLARSLNEALQEAYFYVEVLAAGGETTSLGAIRQRLQEIRAEANKKHFPELLKLVGDRLHAPLDFAEEYASLQKVRNCLEHRGGIVAKRDVDAEGKLTLRFPTFQLSIIKTDGSEIQLERQESLVIEGGGSVVVRIGRIERSYLPGQRIVLTPFDYVQIAQGCIAFCLDLEAKLPSRRPSAAGQ